MNKTDLNDEELQDLKKITAEKIMKLVHHDILKAIEEEFVNRHSPRMNRLIKPQRRYDHEDDSDRWDDYNKLRSNLTKKIRETYEWFWEKNGL